MSVEMMFANEKRSSCRFSVHQTFCLDTAWRRRFIPKKGDCVLVRTCGGSWVECRGYKKRERALQTIIKEGEDVVSKTLEREKGGSNNGVGARVHLWMCCVVSMLNENGR